MSENTGRPPHEPTNENRLKVKTLAAVGTRFEDIAKKLGISVSDLDEFARSEGIHYSDYHNWDKKYRMLSLMKKVVRKLGWFNLKTY